ncbi:hypothetical protein A2264_04065 [candidate division WWE3 bacterium RIFOXYA2_FULL_46_9]|uniref:Uncharacterized protein n=1 Tax=candidate division WWE3 bacterium RIFOXYA2_FULL_46_9 TaxID=1802636 RepID=A0A1F4W074_UNCKA|nr:MAG: hypothetical protein A2264_04065 [candidate division WWE3 bacterium RIFOXYA2_FULL_46_9]OGC65155.1 MAG: hypothetical protein A2326_02245 [candidate division WWE3 bacterium RIFOXYB2_FULL_41_6]HLD50887.1 hypothetical protein [Patescibacteria group bacterium]
MKVEYVIVDSNMKEIHSGITPSLPRFPVREDSLTLIGPGGLKAKFAVIDASLIPPYIIVMETGDPEALRAALLTSSRITI